MNFSDVSGCGWSSSLSRSAREDVKGGGKREGGSGEGVGVCVEESRWRLGGVGLEEEGGGRLEVISKEEKKERRKLDVVEGRAHSSSKGRD